MFVRRVTRDDLPEILEIASTAFKHDELYTWIYPYQTKHLDDFKRMQLIHLRTRLVSVGNHGFVTVTEEKDPYWSGTPEVTGFAFYVRNGKDKAGEKWRTDSLFNKLERHLLSWEMSYETRFLNRASDPARVKAFMGAGKTHWDLYNPLDPRWHLGTIAISTSHQHRGPGDMLLDVGQRLADVDSVPLTLEASIVGRAWTLPELGGSSSGRKASH
ncbi:hypothetical protein K504DRAFT_536859 [Pleomassaria siparia CBS 279.74]|uniref:N-acetyltransferase domain-containing protein n=1 Tax=Pleomassaria siparia CBS 279.74 TaxID=1314801 RepID=A0A6G1JZI9_9PLEO|nr:hypothetical protein K504DRAFT_536859 [Pleomassaria siparia CBS 279.74]